MSRTCRAIGVAAVRIVGHSAAQIETNKIALDKHRDRATKDIHSWYVDVATNSLVVSARSGKESAAKAFAAGGGVDNALVSVVASAEVAHPVYDIPGGDGSVGFSVAGGFVSAGHCGGTGSPTLDHNDVSQGTFAGSSFPHNNYCWIRTNADWTYHPWVNNYSGGNVQVAGSQGASICRSGRTTGWRCGTPQGRDETVNYSAGAVYGLSRMSAFAEPERLWRNGSNWDWEFTGGTLRTQNNKCVDALLALWDCNGGANQKWRRG